jgi:transcription initiation factor TFIID subunit 9B
MMMDLKRAQGVTDVEQKVINQGMEFMHRYTSEVLAEASIASKHAKKTTLDVEDVKLGAKAVLLSQFVDPPSLGDAHAMANAVNKNPLPKLSERPGIHVPTELNLLSDNYDIGPARAHEVAADLEKQAEAKAAAAAAAAAAAIASSSKATEPSAMGAHDPLAFEVKGKAADEPTAADVGDFAEFMMDDDDMEE